MRLLVAFSGLALAAQVSGVTWTSEQDDSARLAIAIRCGYLRGEARIACDQQWEGDFEAGLRDPEGVVQLHCTRWRSPWTSEKSEPPSLCKERYGGWILRGYGAAAASPIR